jgi:hypothetical protein
MFTMIPLVPEFLARQLELVDHWHQASYQVSEDVDFKILLDRQHWANFSLWHEEDLARDPDATDSVIAQVKRNIDKLNQQRNDLIEQLDEHLLRHLQSIVKPDTNTRINSETPGSIIDRLSISALKIFHMQEQVNRTDAAEDHRQRCQAKLHVLNEQRCDLGNSLDQLWADLLQGRKQMKIYRQMKMYNDATLNPVLYRQFAG